MAINIWLMFTKLRIYLVTTSFMMIPSHENSPTLELIELFSWRFGWPPQCHAVVLSKFLLHLLRQKNGAGAVDPHKRHFCMGFKHGIWLFVGIKQTYDMYDMFALLCEYMTWKYYSDESKNDHVLYVKLYCNTKHGDVSHEPRAKTFHVGCWGPILPSWFGKE